MDEAKSKKGRRRAQREIRLGYGEGRSRTPVVWELKDPYYWLMQIRWPAFVGAVVTVFLLINLAFGAAYALLPGAIANVKPGSFADGFFFSIDTLATVGYGNMFPATHLGNAIASGEILIGLFFMATVTGLIFARFSRPKKGVVFSRLAVIGRHEGKRALMVRAVWTRPYPLLDATAQLSWLDVVTHAEGHTIRRLRELELVRSRNPVMGLAWTLVHILPNDSDIVAAVENAEPLLLTATVSGTDMLLASQSQSLQRYLHGDVRLDQEFAEMVFEDHGDLRLELARLNTIQPAAQPQHD